jgi:hypothetical protein
MHSPRRHPPVEWNDRIGMLTQLVGQYIREANARPPCALIFRLVIRFERVSVATGRIRQI